MTRFDGSTALKLDFGGMTTTGNGGVMSAVGRGRGGLRLAVPGGAVRGPDKYRILEHRRRQAQIRARRLLDLMEEAR